ncbi:hypothetical protein B4123_1123 [Bacillus paralicheniformis]|nr:hypothetical protein B4123_1123 [Bacillus paralicheniformis]TWJ56868.1 hypothetical protein CHCC5023_1113 [Bacillus paralicheniformis]TWJ80625.1 hypothetical protein CHCC5019_3518 [Bacillus paralicheniformis]TWN88968.1 hypothetical protein CHCC20490_1524 [Bacillus paralicheniformis]
MQSFTMLHSRTVLIAGLKKRLPLAVSQTESSQKREPYIEVR